MGENDRDQHRLLLASGTGCGWHGLARHLNPQIIAVRPGQGPSGTPVAPAIFGQSGGKIAPQDWPAGGI